MIHPANIVERDSLQLAGRRESLRTFRHQALDHALADFFVIDLVAGYREEAFADRIFLVHFPSMNRRACKPRRTRRIEIRQQRPPIHDRDLLVVAPRLRRERVEVDIRRVEALALGALINFRELRRLASPFHREDIRLRDRRRLDQAALGNFEFAHETNAPVHRLTTNLPTIRLICQIERFSLYSMPSNAIRNTASATSGASSSPPGRYHSVIELSIPNNSLVASRGSISARKSRWRCAFRINCAIR